MNNIHNQWCHSGLKSGVVQRGGGEISVFWCGFGPLNLLLEANSCTEFRGRFNPG